MRLSRRKRPTSATMDITPMIDITFLLLIFFITVTQVSETSKEPIDLPKQKGEEDEKIANLTINVTATDEIIVQGNTLSLGELITLVGRELVQVGDNPARVKIVLRARRNGNSRVVNEILDSLNRLGVTQIRVAVEETE